MMEKPMFWILAAGLSLLLLLLLSWVLVSTLRLRKERERLRDARDKKARETAATQAEQYRLIMDNHRDLLKMQHDQRHFLMGLLATLSQGNTAEAITSVEAELERLGESRLVTGENDLITTLINTNAALARDKGIGWEYHAHKLPSVTVPYVDLAILLGNALDNALEAAARIPNEGARWVSVTVTVKHETLVILVKNAVLRDVDIQRLETAKGSPERHGLGIPTMRALVRKYKGDLVFSCEDRVFTTLMVLKNLDNHS